VVIWYCGCGWGSPTTTYIVVWLSKKRNFLLVEPTINCGCAVGLPKAQENSSLPLLARSNHMNSVVMLHCSREQWSMPPLFMWFLRARSSKKLCSTVHVNSGDILHCSSQIGFGPKLKMHWTGSDLVKQKKNIFNCVLFEKLVLNIIQWQRSLDDITFAEFDRNLNFVPDYILPDVVPLLKNQENCSPCRM